MTRIHWFASDSDFSDGSSDCHIDSDGDERISKKKARWEKKIVKVKEVHARMKQGERQRSSLELRAQKQEIELDELYVEISQKDQEHTGLHTKVEYWKRQAAEAEERACNLSEYAQKLLRAKEAVEEERDRLQHNLRISDTAIQGFISEVSYLNDAMAHVENAVKVEKDLVDELEQVVLVQRNEAAKKEEEHAEKATRMELEHNRVKEQLEDVVRSISLQQSKLQDEKEELQQQVLRLKTMEQENALLETRLAACTATSNAEDSASTCDSVCASPRAPFQSTRSCSAYLEHPPSIRSTHANPIVFENSLACTSARDSDSSHLLATATRPVHRSIQSYWHFAVARISDRACNASTATWSRRASLSVMVLALVFSFTNGRRIRRLSL